VKSYSEREIFSERELAILQRATALVARLDDSRPALRCHELARAVGLILDLPHVDGHYGFVQHSWLWTKPPGEIITPRVGLPNILDVYAVGSLPMVRLVDCQCVSLPHVGWGYRPGPDRTDIDAHLVHDLVNAMKARDLWR
jgi:hypothetical protein